MRYAPSANSRLRRIGLYAGGFIGPFGGPMVIVLIPEFRDVFDVSTATASLAITVYVIPFAALQLLSGTVGERVGRDRVLRVAFAVYALGSIASALASSIVPFLIARVVQGSANAFTSPLALAKFSELTPKEELGRAMGTFAAVQTAGAVMAPLIGGLAGSVDYRLAFVAAALVALILLVIVPERKPKPDPAHIPSIRSAFTPRTRWLCLAAAVMFMCSVGLGVIVSLLLADEFGLGADLRGLLLASAGVAGVIVGRPAGNWVDRVGARRIVMTGISLTAVMLVAIAFSGDQWTLSALWFLAGGSGAMVVTSLNTLMVSASARNRGGAISMVYAFRFFGAALAPVIWIPLYNVSAELTFLAAAFGMAIVAFAARRALTASTGPPAAKEPEAEPVAV